MAPSSAQASAPKNDTIPAKIQTLRIDHTECSSWATLLGTRKMPAPMITPMTIESASSKPRLRGSSEDAVGAAVMVKGTIARYRISALMVIVLGATPSHRGPLADGHRAVHSSSLFPAIPCRLLFP